MADLLRAGIGLICVVLLLRVARTDFRTLRIPNRDVLLLLAPAIAFALLQGRGMIVADLAAAGLLFCLGLLFWLLRMMGAGDAKLYAPVGLLVGWEGLVLYVITLLAASVVLLLAIRLGPRLLPAGPLSARLTELGAGRGVPYAVPMAAGAILAMALTRF